jgi:hypothetical protein
MSDTMLFGVLKMPFELAMHDEISRIQFYTRAQELVARVEAQPETNLRQAAQQEPVAYDKTEINCFVQDLYDEKMQEGKHGHYETLFHVVHQAIKKVAPPKQQAEPIGFITPPGPITQYRIPTQTLPDEIVRLAGVALHEMPRPRTDWHSCAKLVCEAVVAHGIKEGT